VEHIEYFYKLRTYTKPSEETIQKQLEWVGIEKEFWKKKPGTYSKGMKQRLGIALAFTGTPKFIVLDEPFAHIDPLGRQHLLREIKRYQREHSAIIIMSSHVISEIEQIADNITILDHGKILISEDFLKLSLQHDSYEFDIVSLTSNQEHLESFFSQLNERKELKFTDIRLSKGKILLNTKFPDLIHSFLAKYSTDLFIKPTSGFLDKFYMDILEGIK
jgi:ABC-type multidrug transport system ATPase subunit